MEKVTVISCVLDVGLSVTHFLNLNLIDYEQLFSAIKNQ